jgi:hypothetical protein
MHVKAVFARCQALHFGFDDGGAGGKANAEPKKSESGEGKRHEERRRKAKYIINVGTEAINSRRKVNLSAGAW